MFKATITFTGICSLVPRDQSRQEDLSYCVVLPNAWFDSTKVCPDPPKPGLDGISKIQAHRSILHFDSGRLENSPSQLQGLECVHFLQSQRVLFIPEATTVPGCTVGDIAGLARAEDVTSSSTKDLLSVTRAVNSPDKCTVAAHAVIEHGEVSCPKGALTWVFDNYLRTEPPRDRALNHEVKVTLKDIDKLTVRIKDLFSTTSIKDYVFKGNSDLHITIANLCLQDPLQWQPIDTKNDPVDDHDFRLHYEIVDDRVKLKTNLRSLAAPIPRATVIRPNGNGFNCFPKLFAPVAFNPRIWD